VRLRQVLTNLLANAIKFTDEGEVFVSVACAEHTVESMTLRIEVKDTGIGIAPSDIDRLFESFAQADTSTTRTHGGTGLGLTISRQLVEMMGGEIGAYSTPGKGSAFWFTVQLATTAISPRERRFSDLSGLRVLVVDDNTTNREILERYLVAWGMRPQCADSAADALRLLHAGTGCPDLAILDFLMPGMDGIELARAIRSDPALDAMRLLLLSSVGMECAQSSKAAGIAASLTKPARRSHLLESIISAIADDRPPASDRGERAAPPSRPIADLAEAPTEASAPPPGTQEDERVSILVVEDNTINQTIAVLNLQKRGYHVLVAGDGQQALDVLARTPCAAVLMDCQMPLMDGYEATAEIRRREGTERHTPIIAMTAHAMNADRDKCLAAGMDDYLSKPVRAAELDVILARWAPQRRPAS